MLQRSCRWLPLRTWNHLQNFRVITFSFQLLCALWTPSTTVAVASFCKCSPSLLRSSRPNFCLVTLALCRNRRYFIVLLQNHIMVIYHNYNRTTTASEHPIQWWYCLVPTRIKISAKCYQSAGVVGNRKGKEKVKKPNEHTANGSRKVFKTSGLHDQIRCCYFKIYHGNNSLAHLRQSSQSLKQCAASESLTYLNEEDFIHGQGLQRLGI